MKTVPARRSLLVATLRKQKREKLDRLREKLRDMIARNELQRRMVTSMST